MAAPTQYYCDPLIAANSGTGTIGDPFGDLQYALNTIVRDATNGDQINIKAGTAEILAAALTLATYGTPTTTAPLILRGYTAAANDGGMGEIDANGFTFWAAATYPFWILAELTIHNFGNNNGIVSSGNSPTIYKCNIHKGASTPSGKTLVSLTVYGRVIGSYIHDAGTTGVGADVRFGHVYGSYIYNCPIGITLGISVAVNNILVDCATGINSIGSSGTNLIANNSLYSSTANTGVGILSNAAVNPTIINNIIQGYSGAGGRGIANTSGFDIVLLGYNAFFNNTTSESYAGDVFIDLGNDATLAASPFTNPAGGDFSLNTAVAGAIDGAFPGAFYGPASTTDHADIGAVQNGGWIWRDASSQ